MLDVGFWELLFIGVVALIVIGPERLPRVARAAGLWVGKARRFIADVKTDIDNELEAEDMRRQIDEIGKDMDFSDIKKQLSDDELIRGGRSAAEDARPSADELAQETAQPDSDTATLERQTRNEADEPDTDAAAASSSTHSTEPTDDGTGKRS